MEIVGNWQHIQQANGAWQSAAKCTQESTFAVGPLGVEVENLPNGMDAGVSSPGSDGRYVPPKDLLQASLDKILDGIAIWLTLPAAE
jgi:hypothetical protein